MSKVENSTNAQSQVAKRVIELHKTKAQEKKNEVSVKKANAPKEQPKQVVTPPTVQPVNTTVLTPQQTDIYESLKEKFSEKEILLIRRALTYMTLACPSASKPLLEQLKLHAINQLKLS